MSSMLIEYVNGTETGRKFLEGTDGSAHTLEQGQEAGGRNQDSALGNDYSATANEWIVETVSERFPTGTGDKTIVSGPAVVTCVRVKRGAAALSGDVTIKAGSVTVDTLASGATALTEVDYKGGCRFYTSFIINVANAADLSKIQVIYRPGDTRWAAVS